MASKPSNWTFFSNHGHVYFLLATNEHVTLREVAAEVGITERTVVGIVQDLEDDGYLKRKKVGRTNTYKITPRKKLRHPLESNVRIQDLIELIQKSR